MSFIVRVIGAGICALLLGACAPLIRSGTISTPTLTASGGVPSPVPSLTVTVEPITLQNYTEPQFAHFAPVITTPLGSRTFPLGPMPAFRVVIANHTGHVLRLRDAVFRLDDDARGQYRAIRSIDDLGDWLASAHAARLARDPALVSALMRGLDQLRNELLTPDVVMLNDDETTFFLLFNVPGQEPIDYARFLAGRQHLVVRLAELPVEFDAAGAVTRAIEVQVGMDVTRYEQRVTCLESLTDRTLQTCQIAR